MKNMLVIGGSRGIGKEAVKLALEAGYMVTAFARNTEILDIKNANLRLVDGDVLDLSSLEKVVKDQDVVICSLGLPTLRAIGPPLTNRSYILSTGTSNVIKAMEKHGVKRFLCVTAIGTSESIDQCSWLTKIALRHILRWLFNEKDIQEKLISVSGLDWTIIRPTALTNAKPKGAVIDNNIHCGLLTQIPRVDVASLMIAMITDTATFNKALILSLPPKLGDSLRWVVGYFGLN
jgi:putative NADH-flavin reductase